MKMIQRFLLILVCCAVSMSLRANDEQLTQSTAADKPAPVATSEKNLPPQRELIDKIVVRVNGDNILHSDLEQPRIAKEGGNFTVEEAISETLFYQQAAEKHMLPSSEDVSRQLITFKIQNNMASISDEEFEDQLAQHGFTTKAYKQELGHLVAIENVKRAEMSEKIVVTTQEVEDYCTKNPEHTIEEYHLNICSIPTEKKSEIDTLIKDNKVTWEDLGWIAREDIGKKFECVFSMEKGTPSDPIKLDKKTYQVIKLVDRKERRLKTLDERYGEIERILQQERKEKFVEKFEKELRDKATIVRL